MTGHEKNCWLHIVVSGLLLVFSLTALTVLSIECRWTPAAGIVDLALFLILWLVWFSHLIWFLARGRLQLRPDKRLLTGICVVIASVIAGTGLYHVGPIWRAYEIRQALKAGLIQDCANLLDQWPIEGDRIFPSTPEYDRLPISIRMLNPVYVTNDHKSMTDIPPHVGICTCGFGGFAIGVRVFHTDQAAEAFRRLCDGWYRRMFPGVYYCKHPT